MSANPSQLFLLADHIKLSLLEQQRAQSLKLPFTTQDASITRSLSTFGDGLEALETELQTTPDSTLQDQVSQLRKQYSDLSTQFKGNDSSTSSSTQPPSSNPTITQPNDPSLASDFAAAQSGSQGKSKPISKSNTTGRYRDDPDEDAGAAAERARNSLFTGNARSSYRDSPSPSRRSAAEAAEQGELTNEQIHAQHGQIMAEQDEALDRLGVSIGRQRELSMRIGDELDEQVAMLEDVEDGVDRHQGRLDGARDRLGRFAKKATSADWSWYIIGGLILVLVLLIAVLK